MRNIIILFAVLFLSSCSNEKERQALENRYNEKVDSITTAVSLRDSAMNELISSFNEIELNLDSVAKKQNVIALDMERSGGDLKMNVKARINAQIEAINALMEKNEAKIVELNKKLKNSSVRVKEFRNTISLLNDQILQKNSELELLQDKLAASHIQIVQLQVSVDTLSSENYEQSQMLAAQTTSIHTAYYLVGKTKELSDKKIIDKDGGLLGIGKSAKLSEKFDPEYFTKIDYRQILTIPIYSRKAKIITTHPFDSYIMDKGSDNKFTQMRILQPDKFWSASKYLVIATN